MKNSVLIVLIVMFTGCASNRDPRESVSSLQRHNDDLQQKLDDLKRENDALKAFDQVFAVMLSEHSSSGEEITELKSQNTTLKELVNDFRKRYEDEKHKNELLQKGNK
ncbi:hypothetical protein FACS1894200_07610 [Spirochaetia bacterium]|nr:hypothetical protein FACS1894200_07610 [Spirochaetia bacterium]